MLLKNVLATLGQKWMQLVAIGLIVATSSMLFTTMFYGLSGIAEPTTAYLAESAQEDFSVEVLNVVTPAEAQAPVLGPLIQQGKYALTDVRRAEPAAFDRLMDDRISAFEAVFPDTSLELRAVKVFDFERLGRTHQALVARDAERINKSFLEAGDKPTRDDEVAINRRYAEKNGIGIGGVFYLGERRLRVTGFVLFPDYTLTTFDNTMNIDSGLQPLVLLTDAAYDSVSGAESFRFAGLTSSGVVETSYDLKRLPFVTQIIPTTANLRSGAIYDELNQGRTMSLGLSAFIAAIAVVIVSIMMSNLLNAERGQIGLLKAMGYRRLEIAWPYFAAMTSFALVMLVLGYVMGLFLAEPLKLMYLDFYLLPQVPITPQVSVFATAIFVPLVSFALFSGLVILKMLGQRPLALLQPHESGSVNLLTRWVERLLRGARAATKFRYLHAVRSTGTFVVFFVGIMFSTLLITFAFMMGGMVDRMTVGSLNEVAYRYQAFVDPEVRPPEPRPGDEKFLVYPYAYVGTKVVTLHGLRPDSALYALRDASGTDITGQLRHDAVVSKGLALKLSIAEGQHLTVRVNDEVYDLPVAGVADDYSADTIFLDLETLSRLLTDGRDARLFSGIYAFSEPPAGSYETVVSKQSIIDQSQAMATYSSFVINFMVVAAALIAGSILFVLTAFAVEKNYYSISLLKVLGYSRREVNSMILDSYFVYSLISYAVSLPIAMLILDALMRVFLLGYGLVLPLELQPLDWFKGLGLLTVIFLVGTYASRRKIASIPLQEVIKAYGE